MFVPNLKTIRERRKWTIAELVNQYNRSFPDNPITKSELAAIEDGRREPTVVSALKISRLLSCTLEQLQNKED